MNAQQEVNWTLEARNNVYCGAVSPELRFRVEAVYAHGEARTEWLAPLPQDQVAQRRERAVLPPGDRKRFGLGHASQRPAKSREAKALGFASVPFLLAHQTCFLAAAPKLGGFTVQCLSFDFRAVQVREIPTSASMLFCIAHTEGEALEFSTGFSIRVTGEVLFRPLGKESCNVGRFEAQVGRSLHP